MIIALYAFNSRTSRAGRSELDDALVQRRVARPDVRYALWLSVEIGLVATAIALVLGSMAAFAIHRFKFFGRESISFLLLLRSRSPGSSPAWR